MIKDKQGLKTGTYIFSKTGLMSGKYTFSRNKKNESSDNKESIKKETLSDSMKRIHSNDTQEEKNAKNKHKTINISNVAKDSQKETTHVKEVCTKSGRRNAGQQNNDDDVFIQKVRQAFGLDNGTVFGGNEDNNLDIIKRDVLIEMLKEGMKIYLKQKEELNSIRADFNRKAAELGKMWAKQYMSNYLSCIEEMAKQIISCQSTLKQMGLDNNQQLKNFCNYIPMDSDIAALWPERENKFAFDPKMNDFDNFGNTVHSNTDTNYDTTIPHNYDQFINNPEQFINNPFINKNPNINKNNPLTNGGIPVTFYSYDPTYNNNMIGQDQTNNNLLNNLQMMETNCPNNLLNYEDYGYQPITNSESKHISNNQNLNL